MTSIEQAKADGNRDRSMGRSRSSNPYARETLRRAWLTGYDDLEEENKQREHDEWRELSADW